MARKTFNGGMGNEPWYASRRVWGALAAAGTTFCTLIGWVPGATVLGSLATVLIGWSYSKPK